jgi:hypothetical protein
MVPGSWLAVLLFFLLVAPGLAFDLLSQRRRTAVSESTFREISRVILASIAFSGVALAILATVRATIEPMWLPDPAALLRDGARYAKANYQALAWTLVAGVIFSVTLAGITHLILARIAGGARIRQRSAWTRVFKADCPPARFPYARIRLDDGSVYAGKVQDYSPDIETADREIVLGPPFLRSKIGDGALTDIPKVYERVVIPGSAIRAISVAYWPEDIKSPK